MKIKNLLIFTAVFALVPAFAFAATDTPTDTETPTASITKTATITKTVTRTITGTPPTETSTPTVTGTATGTSTVTPTFTITPTHTNSPTPQASVYAYPNPAAYRDTMFVAYPSKTGSASDLKRVIITIYGANGDYVARIIDDFPNGYTQFDISKLARGTYIYKVVIRYQDNTEETFKYKKFAIIK